MNRHTTLHLSPAVTGGMGTGTLPTGANPAQIQRAAGLRLQYGELKQPFNVQPLLRG